MREREEIRGRGWGRGQGTGVGKRSGGGCGVWVGVPAGRSYPCVGRGQGGGVRAGGMGMGSAAAVAPALGGSVAGRRCCGGARRAARGAARAQGSSFAGRRLAGAPARARVALRAGRREAASAEAVKYHAVVASAQFLLTQEPMAEQLRERARFLKETGKERDFWLTFEPDWMDRVAMPGKTATPALALISTDFSWITFMKLRLDRVMQVEFESEPLGWASKGGTDFKPTFPKDWGIGVRNDVLYDRYPSGWWEQYYL